MYANKGRVPYTEAMDPALINADGDAFQLSDGGFLFKVTAISMVWKRDSA